MWKQREREKERKNGEYQRLVSSLSLRIVVMMRAPYDGGLEYLFERQYARGHKNKNGNRRGGK
jgi:hypothetical protein